MSGERSSTRQLTTLLTNTELGRVERLRIQSLRRFTNRSQGDHRSRGGGRSIEFKDYRDYVAGDDLRFLDWNIYARLRRPYIKLFHDEEELHVVLLVDGSTSMNFEDKFLRSRQLAAAFGIMGLVGGDRVSVHVFYDSNRGTRSLLVPRGRRGVAPLLAFLEDMPIGGDSPVEEGLESMLKTHRGRGVLIVLSDFLTRRNLASVFNQAHGRGLEIFGLQILGPSELNPEWNSDLRLVDSETAQTLDITDTEDLLAIYHEHRLAFQRHLQSLCQRRNGRFLPLDSSLHLADMLFDVLRRRGWVR
ncbi:MAG: DUF58 domain-containing protein [Planctomycetota bacterium]|jgi:uncharacterized protein (DUF58 family)